MGSIKRMVLTGGPCAGKSSSLELIREYLKNNGYIVFVVGESATEMINSGIKCFGDKCLAVVDFEEILLNYQLEKDRIVDSVVNNYYKDKDVVIIYDREIIDFKAYVSNEDFYNLLNKYNLSELDILNKFDLVIHLETAANGKDYTNLNNKARSETEKEAIDLDNKVYEAWKKHNNLIKIRCYDNFIDKQKEIIRICEENLIKKEVKKLKLVK